jgi:hypothetical protein
MDDKLSRREVLQRGAGLGALVVLGAAAACHKAPAALACTDTTGLAAGDLQVRTSLGYEDTSTQPGKQCSGCVQFIPGPQGACGTCKVIKGPINPGGYCKSFAPKPA